MIRLTSNAKVQKCKLKSENGAINNPSAETFSSVSGSPDRGRLPENTVYLQLRRSGQEVWYFKGKKECDFICREKKNTFSAIPVSWEVGQQNEKREVEGLLEAMNLLNLTKGTIITFDQEDRFVKEGKTIRLIPGWKWMG